MLQKIISKQFTKEAKNASRLLAPFFCILILISPHSLHAQGVTAGTEIANTVVVTYAIAGNAQIPIESTPTGNSSPGVGNGQATTFKVDRKIDLLLTGDTNANISPGDTQSEVTFTLTNEGNDTQEFHLTDNKALTGDDFDSNNCHISINHTKDASGAITQLAPPISTGIITLAPDHQAVVSVKCDIPLSFNGQAILLGQTSLISLTANAQKNADGTSVTQTMGADSPDSVDTVFADNAGTDDANQDASHSARRSFIATNSSIAPTLSINKSIINVIDPQGGNKAISGANVTYKITVSTAGTGVINNVVITDPSPSNMTYKTNTIYLGSHHLTDLNDNDNANFNASSKIATINLGSLNAGTQHEIKLSYIIN